MSLHNWFSSRLAGCVGARVRQAIRSSTHCRPACERLEDRTVPTILSVPPAHIYHLNNTLADSLGGPSLTSQGGTFQGDRYVFGPNQGLQLQNGLASTNNYSIVMKFEIDALDPFYKKILDFSNRTSDNGLYIAGSRLQLFPGGGGTTDIAPNTDVQLVLTQDASTGKTRIYLDGVLQQEYNGGVFQTATPPDNLLAFFEDDLGTQFLEAKGGSVDYIATFNGVLSQADVTALATSAFSVGTNQTLVSVLEGQAAGATGTWGDSGIEAVNLSASVGTVTKNADGTWAWSYTPADGPFSQNVTITATDSDGETTSTSFTLSVSNVPPAVTADAPSVSVNEGQTASATGTWSDPGVDIVELTASFGTVVRNDDGTWAWSFTPADGPDGQSVTITATDSDGATSSVTFSLTVNNVAPSVAADSSSVAVDEGQTATQTGTWADPGTDDVFLSASVGTVLLNADGTWTWSYSTADGPDDSQFVTITAKDSDGGTRSITFDLIVNNVAPTVASNHTSVTVDAGQTAFASGTWADPGLDNVTLSASVGSVIRNADGTWTWTYTPGSSSDSQTVTITARDSDGDASSVSFLLTVNHVNTGPVVTPNAESVAVVEGGTAAMNGTWSGTGKVTLSASVGKIVRHADGTWTWTYSPGDGPGTRTVTITARDKNGQTSTTSFTLTVQNAPPRITGLLSSHATRTNPSANGRVTIAGAFTDRGLRDTHRVTVNWGDGTQESMSANQFLRTFQRDHRYSHGGVFTITVTVTDDDGASVSATTTAVVVGVGVVNGTLYVIGSENYDSIDIKSIKQGGVEVGYRVEVRLGNKPATFTFSRNVVENIVIVVGRNDNVQLARGVTADVQRVSQTSLQDVLRELACFLQSLLHRDC